jgi:DNA-binding NarL/FixJ family response regulator
MGNDHIEIIVADSQPLFRAGLKAMFVHDLGFRNVSDARDVAEVTLCLIQNPSVALVAIEMDLPGMNGVAGIRHLRARFPAIRFLVISGRAERGIVIDVLTAGAHGCIIKTMTDAETLEALRAVLSGQVYVPSMLAELTPHAPKSGGATQHGSPQDLTLRQRQVLDLVAAGKSNKEIARALRIAESTVKVHVAAAFRVLGVHNRVGAASALHDREHPELEEPTLPGLLHARRRTTDRIFHALVGLIFGASWMSEPVATFV